MLQRTASADLGRPNPAESGNLCLCQIAPKVLGSWGQSSPQAHGAAKDPHLHPSPPCSLASVGLLRFSVGVC